MLTDPSALVLVPLVFGLLLLVRGLPAVAFRSAARRPATLASGLLLATSLPFLLIAAEIGESTGVLTSSQAGALALSWFVFGHLPASRRPGSGRYGAQVEIRGSAGSGDAVDGAVEAPRQRRAGRAGGRPPPGPGRGDLPRPRPGLVTDDAATRRRLRRVDGHRRGGRAGDLARGRPRCRQVRGPVLVAHLGAADLRQPGQATRHAGEPDPAGRDADCDAERHSGPSRFRPSGEEWAGYWTPEGQPVGLGAGGTAVDRRGAGVADRGRCRRSRSARRRWSRCATSTAWTVRRSPT